MSEAEKGASRLQQSLANKKRSAKPQVISLSGQDLVKLDYFQPEQKLPLLIRPARADVDLTNWVKSNTAFLQTQLYQHGAILFRDFALRTQEDFSNYLTGIEAPLVNYMEGATPRAELGSHIYTSTLFPADQTIAQHNELSYTRTWPMLIWFFCVTPAEQGGETPLADMRKVLQRISATTREQFERRGWMLARNFVPGFGLPWQTSFRSQTKEEVEKYFRESWIDWEWRADDTLRTTQVRPAISTHPVTGERVWFNHIAFWHVSSLDASFRQAFLAEYSEDELPYNTFYGDGSPIDEATIEEIRQAYDQETIAFRWQTGDLLMLDNVLVSHGRNPFAGSRNTLTAMGAPFTRSTPEIV